MLSSILAPARADSCGQPIDPVASRAMHRYGMSLTIAVAGAALGVAAGQRSNANAAAGSRFEIVEATIPADARGDGAGTPDVARSRADVPPAARHVPAEAA